MNKDKQQRDFVSHFLYSAYANMEMENEVRGMYDEAYMEEKYKDIIDSLVEDEVYTDMTFKDD